MSKSGVKVSLKTERIEALPEHLKKKLQRQSFQQKVIDYITDLTVILVRHYTARVTTKDLVVTFQTLAFAFSQGMPLITTLRAIAESFSPRMKVILYQVITYLESGYSLNSALAKFPWIFDTITVKLVQVGEITGKLDEQLHLLARHIEERELLRRKIISALQYPMIFLLVSITVFGIFVKYVFPLLEKFAPPQGISKIVFDTMKLFGNFLNPITLMLIFIVMFSVYTVLTLVLKAEPSWLINYKYKLPVLGKILLYYDLMILITSLNSLYSSGVALSEGIRVLSERAGGLIGDILRDLNEALIVGRSISDTLRLYKNYIPSYIIGLIEAGEESGSLSESFKYVIRMLRYELDSQTTALISLLEPAVVIGLGALTLLVFIAIAPSFLKLYNPRNLFNAF